MKILLMILKNDFDTSDYSEDDERPRPRDMNKNKIDFFKDELGGKIMTEFIALRAKTFFI